MSNRFALFLFAVWYPAVFIGGAFLGGRYHSEFREANLAVQASIGYAYVMLVFAPLIWKAFFRKAAA